MRAKWQRDERAVPEEYCWAMTQTAGWSCFGRSSYCVWDTNFELTSLYTDIIHDMYPQFRLEKNYTPNHLKHKNDVTLYQSDVTV